MADVEPVAPGGAVVPAVTTARQTIARALLEEVERPRAGLAMVRDEGGVAAVVGGDAHRPKATTGNCPRALISRSAFRSQPEGIRESIWTRYEYMESQNFELNSTAA